MANGSLIARLLCSVAMAACSSNVNIDTSTLAGWRNNAPRGCSHCFARSIASSRSSANVVFLFFAGDASLMCSSAPDSTTSVLKTVLPVGNWIFQVLLNAFLSAHQCRPKISRRFYEQQYADIWTRPCCRTVAYPRPEQSCIKSSVESKQGFPLSSISPD